MGSHAIFCSCYDACLTPTHPGPAPCTVTPIPTRTPTPTPIFTADCSAISICKDYINDCGQMYGG